MPFSRPLQARFGFQTRSSFQPVVYSDEIGVIRTFKKSWSRLKTRALPQSLSHICDIFLDNVQTGQLAWQSEIAAYKTNVALYFVHSRLAGGTCSTQTTPSGDGTVMSYRAGAEVTLMEGTSPAHFRSPARMNDRGGIVVDRDLRTTMKPLINTINESISHIGI
jgi:hypothetical protein